MQIKNDIRRKIYQDDKFDESFAAHQNANS
jgi:hypothetical protein